MLQSSVFVMLLCKDGAAPARKRAHQETARAALAQSLQSDEDLEDTLTAVHQSLSMVSTTSCTALAAHIWPLHDLQSFAPAGQSLATYR